MQRKEGFEGRTICVGEGKNWPGVNHRNKYPDRQAGCKGLNSHDVSKDNEAEKS